MPIITARKNEILDALLLGVAFTSRNGDTVSLHTDDPGQAGANEVTGGSYARQSIPWEASSAEGDLTTTAAIEFADMPTITVSHVMVWDDSIPIWNGALASPVSLDLGQTFRIGTGELITAINGT